MENESDNVITLVQPKRNEEKLLNITVTDRKNHIQHSCKHRAIEVCETDRVVRCTKCGCVIDPFEHILQVATDGEHIVTEIEQLHRRRDELRESVANLEREEKNTKARLRAARTAILYAENDLKNIEQEVNRG
ncbi:TPA: hypothetical protein P7Q51_004190 [Escherichia coli]|uniref:hypothetical protein n=1 Tax=Escherichia fergusonii TaxID=564 RepID=UPI001CBB07A1|nr:hypothetical protein [Escherichia fergusonii]EEH6229431.1 hypothetical protein [Salmonella enterica subsp. enterica]EKP5352645.1 hypothetical protein [Salmonella enterica]MCS2046937.1 hypothetical protein [Escherichia coli]MBZ4104370.1 hypothetical protein [Escherichia fergusonii]MBZ4146332.1 hypothetical protein [Escherichia fergusonii]